MLLIIIIQIFLLSYISKGDKIPLQDKEVDTTILYTVLHHADDPEYLLAEATRVTKKRLIIMEGYVEYQRREFCKDTKCPVQVLMDKLGEGSEEYSELHKICKTKCLSSTYDFHHWLINKGYLLFRPEG